MKVLVIGAGLGGVSAIVGLRAFDKDTEIILVDPKDHCEIYWAAYRSPFEKWVADKSLFLLAQWAEDYKVRHIRSTVTKLTKQTAVLANGNSIEYDVAVVATGAGTKAPFLGRGLPAGENDGSKASRLAQLKKYGMQFLNAESILICGGGLIGTELAGDLAAYAKKQGKTLQVTLVHSGPHLSHVELTPRASAMVQKKLEKLGVKVFLNEKAVEGKDGKMILQSSGQVLEAKEVIYTTGLVPVNDFLKSGDFAESLNENGWVQADEYFRVKNSNGRLFAIGDCSTFLPNSGYQSMDNAKYIGKNIKFTLDSLSKENGTAPDEVTLVKGKASYQVTLSTVGPSGGVFYTPAFHTQWFFPFLKNKTMFLFRPKMELGLKQN
jgi:NADH dehydrogenase FAD-containing subunit